MPLFGDWPAERGLFVIKFAPNLEGPTGSPDAGISLWGTARDGRM